MRRAPPIAPRTRDLLLAVVASGLLVLLAPAIGEARRWLRLSFPGHFVAIVAGATVLMAAAMLGMAILRIETRRVPRFGAIVLAVLIAIAYAMFTSLHSPESDVVEHVHFIEYGVVTWLFYRAWAPLGDLSALLLAMLAALTVGVGEEWVEWFVPARIGELRDILLDGAAIVSGALFSWALRPVPLWPMFRSTRAWRQTCFVAAIAVGALAVFVDSVHIGYEMHDVDGRTFRSIYPAANLARLSMLRQQEWASHPPLERPARFSREDQYASEGLLHVQARNNLWAAGDRAGAWQENRLLEEYFAPVLDAPSYVSRAGHRWPPEQRAEAEREASRRAVDPARFVSHAQGEFPVFTWSRPRFRATAGSVVLVLMLLAVVTPRRVDYPVR